MLQIEASRGCCCLWMGLRRRLCCCMVGGIFSPRWHMLQTCCILAAGPWSVGHFDRSGSGGPPCTPKREAAVGGWGSSDGNTCRKCLPQPSTSPVPPLIPACACIFAGDGKVWICAMFFLLSTLLRASFVFLFVFSAFSGSSFTPSLCEHNLLPPGESFPVPCISLDWETSTGRPAQFCPAQRLVGTFVWPSSALVSESSQGTEKNHIKVKKLSKRGFLWSEGWNFLPVCHCGCLLCCSWMDHVQRILQSCWKGTHGAGLVLCHGCVLRWSS